MFVLYKNVQRKCSGKFTSLAWILQFIVKKGFPWHLFNKEFSALVMIFDLKINLIIELWMDRKKPTAQHKQQKKSVKKVSFSSCVNQSSIFLMNKPAGYCLVLFSLLTFLQMFLVDSSLLFHFHPGTPISTFVQITWVEFMKLFLSFYWNGYFE